jgi:hypothetical protein
VQVRHAPAELEWLWLLLGTLRALLRDRHSLVVENLLLRQQLAVALRARPRPRLRRGDRLFWIMVPRGCADWRRNLVLVQPATASGGTARRGGSSGGGGRVVRSAARGCPRRYAT